MALRPTSGMGRLEFKSGGLLWRMPGRNAGGNPSVLLVCHSESGTATLCGYSEFTSPSTPPKKYRTLSASGFWQTCNWSDSSCAGGSGSSDRMNYTGSCSYSEATCSTSNSLARTYASAAVPCSPGSASSYDTMDCDRPDNPDGGSNGDYVSVASVTDSATSREWDYEHGTWTPCSLAGSFYRTWYGAVTWSLSAEDTEDDAIARATGTTVGTSCTATKETRGAGDFSLLFTVVAYDLICSGLAAGKDYQITYTLTTANYGGASPVATAHTLNFTATGETHTVSDTLDCQSGKQVTISGARIRKL